ncbi:MULTISPECIES: DUF58 domain-containing protein [unclassified Iodidimonas]|jgi:uncharacterized protein (DUF58 family)|uniref:DUF58 domain-containing protein n=1 Tax=unclassified Iodidimonas TaxID=2626145 RepID=UPI0024825DB7|nr:MULTISPECIES: DUF58 domain-containing protein [unclassified Iodidimonas]
MMAWLRSFLSATALQPASADGLGAASGRDPVPISDLWQRAQSLADRLPAHNVRADPRLRAAARGVHGRRRAGPGDSFWQFRPYEQGEHAAQIDWRRSGRSDTLYVRQQEWETAQNIWIWMDRSASMQFGSRPMADSKADRAILLGLATARLLIAAGERVGLYGVHDQAMGGRFGLSRLLESLEKDRLHDDPPFPTATALPRHAQLILIGDFLGESDATQNRLRQLVGLGVNGHLLQIIDPIEDDFPFEGRIRFSGMEQEAPLIMERAEQEAAAYRSRMRAWIDHLGAMARRAGWTHSIHRTDHSPAQALLGLIALTGKRG